MHGIPCKTLSLLCSLSILQLLGPIGCGGGFATRSGAESRRTGTTETGQVQAGEPEEPWTQAMLPEEPIDPEATFQEGDIAFQAGNMARAQRVFGLVYLHDPGFRQGLVVSALNETCLRLGNDCALVMGRLDLLRIVYYEQLGPREEWFPQQEADYQSILACFDHALAGRLDEAYGEGYRVINAPLPLFDQFARLCVDRVQLAHTQRQWAQEHQAARSDWDSAYPSFVAAYEPLSEGLQAEDWDAIVDTYPRYKIAEEPILRILESGVLDNDPDLQEDVARAAEAVAQVQDFEEEQGERYDQMRTAIASLEEDPQYNQALLEYQEIYSRLAPIQEEIATLQTAQQATEGSERRSIERRIEANEAEIRVIRRDLRRVMGTINHIRREWDLPSRDAPYGVGE